jgi:hypothetical protein
MSNPKDWFDPGHLAYMIDHKWQALEDKATAGDIASRIKLSSEIGDLANKILLSKRYQLLIDYYRFMASGMSTDGVAQPLAYRAFISASTELYRKVCQPKHKLLFGIRHSIPLWVDCPEWAWLKTDLTKSKQEMEQQQRQSQFFWQLTTGSAITFMPAFTGKVGQAEYDRLLAPRAENFLKTPPTNSALSDFDERLGRALGFEEPVEADEVMQIQAYAMLEQRYKLVEERPVVIRMEDNPAVREVILMQKGVELFARIETYRLGDLLQVFNLEDPDKREGIFDNYMVFSAFEPGQLQSVNALIASVYRDLVTVDEVSAGARFSTGKSGGRKKKKEEEEPDKPKTYTTSWQIIPRRLYTNRKSEADITVERERLTEQEEGFRRALRRYHAVVGHVRRFKDRPDFSASYERRSLADSDGIILNLGETYVKPHNRGLSALEELGEVDLALVPHYLRRGRKE